MTPRKLKLIVGTFVVICIALTIALLLIFQKGLSFTQKNNSYRLRLRTANVGGLKRQASVLMAGVPVGTVTDIKLDDDTRTVSVYLTILNRYKIHRDAVFNIEAAGFLGDQYVSIVADKNVGDILADDSIVVCHEPFNIQEAARSALGLIHRMDQTVEEIHEAVARVDKTVLGDQSLSNLTTTFSNVRQVSEQTRAVVDRAAIASDHAVALVDKAVGTVDRASTLVDHLDSLVQSNAIPVNTGVTNFVLFTKQLNELSAELKQTVATNRVEFTAAIRNLDAATMTITNILGDLDAGKGLAGGLLKDEKLKLDMGVLMSNLTSLSGNLDMTSSNLNAHGLWWMLWKPKPAATNSTPRDKKSGPRTAGH